MFRLQGHLIPDNKVIRIGLTAVYGIGQSRSKTILDKLGIPLERKVKDVSEEDQKRITDAVKELENFIRDNESPLVENDLRRDVNANIKNLKEIKCYRGMRHNLGLPVRGQKTGKHAKTAKKLLGRSKVRPVLKK
ncbi:MAG: 30S ribosomal protein S13 [Candidatus Absconditabacteria bacterium]